MESPINEYKKKYWEAESSLQEENELKNHYASSSEKSIDANYFRLLHEEKNKTKTPAFKHPGRTFQLRPWILAAAVMAGLIFTTIFVTNLQTEEEFLVEDQQEAYEITRKALQSISNGLEKGQISMNQLDKLNHAKKSIQE